MLYIDQFSDFESFFLTPNDSFYPEIRIKKLCCSSEFAVRMVKQENFINVVELYII